MTTFYEENSKLLTPGAFEFVLDSELKRAVRSQNYLTLATVEARRAWAGLPSTADDGPPPAVPPPVGRRAAARGKAVYAIPMVWPAGEVEVSQGDDIVARFNAAGDSRFGLARTVVLFKNDSLSVAKA